MAVNVGGIQPILNINCQLSRDSSCSALKAVEWRQRWRERATDPHSWAPSLFLHLNYLFFEIFSLLICAGNC
jgi:hypothetical protein